MALYVASNFNALVAQNALTANASSLATSEQRLATGLRINSAGDDAAGLAISTRLTGQINGLNQASQNANNGVSLAQVAQGALGQVTANLQRIRTLAVQSENSTNSTSDRQAIDSEVQQRIQEIQRLATQTSFNGTNLLDGTFSGAAFQVGANVGQTISLGATAQNVQTNSLGSFVSSAGTNSVIAGVAAGTGISGASYSAGAAGTNGNTGGSSYQGVSGTAIAANTLQINGTYVQASSTYAAASNSYQDATSAYAKALAINASGISGVTATATTNLTFDPTNTANLGAGNFVNVNTLASGGSLTYTLSVNGTQVVNQALTTTGATPATGVITTTAVAAAVNSVSSTTGVTASIASNGTLSFAAADGRNVTLLETYSASQGTAGPATTATSAIGAFTQTAFGALGTYTDTSSYRGQVTVNSPSSVTFNTAAQNALIGQGATTGIVAASSSLANQNVQTQGAANNAIFSVDSALTAINSYNATWGAVQNRLTSAINNIGTSVQNLTTANGRILNADFAAESTNLATASVIQQASTSILAQANSQAQQVLKLLQ